jgi:hypothetical protein
MFEDHVWKTTVNVLWLTTTVGTGDWGLLLTVLFHTFWLFFFFTEITLMLTFLISLFVFKY